jgi:hypothetical protein
MNTQKVCQFFATKRDLQEGLLAITRTQSLTLILDTTYPDATIPTIPSLLDIPNFGGVTGRRSERYLVLPAGDRIRPSKLVETPKRSALPKTIATGLGLVGICPPGGKVTYEVRHSNHPSSVLFAPGGWWKSELLIAGEVGTVHTNSNSVALYDLFMKLLLDAFATVKSFKVGPDAFRFLKEGKRLAVDREASPLIDLTLD